MPTHNNDPYPEPHAHLKIPTHPATLGDLISWAHDAIERPDTNEGMAGKSKLFQSLRSRSLRFYDDDGDAIADYSMYLIRVVEWHRRHPGHKVQPFPDEHRRLPNIPFTDAADFALEMRRAAPRLEVLDRERERPRRQEQADDHSVGCNAVLSGPAF